MFLNRSDPSIVPAMFPLSRASDLNLIAPVPEFVSSYPGSHISHLPVRPPLAAGTMSRGGARRGNFDGLPIPADKSVSFRCPFHSQLFSLARFGVDRELWPLISVFGGPRGAVPQGRALADR